MSKTIKWNANSKAHKELVKMLESGAVNPDQKPKSVYDNYPDLFDRYTIKQFSNAWIRLTGDQKVVPAKVNIKSTYMVDCCLIL